MKQTFKGRKLTKTNVVNNILMVYNQTDESHRFDWYNDAYMWAIECLHIAELNAADDANINKACGIIAALSPVKTWSDNKKIALDMLLTEDCGHMMLFKGKAYSILHSNGTHSEIEAILNGKKITAFYNNIRNPHKNGHITIDRHALRVALNEYVSDSEYQGMTKNQYTFFERCFVDAAKKANTTPLIMQSATWVYLRESKQMFNN